MFINIYKKKKFKKKINTVNLKRRSIKLYLIFIYLYNIFSNSEKLVRVPNVNFLFLYFYKKYNIKFFKKHLLLKRRRSSSLRKSKKLNLNILYLNSIYSKFKRIKSIENSIKFRRIKKKFRIRALFAKKKILWRVISFQKRIQLLKLFMEKISFYYFLKKKKLKLKKLNKVNIFDIYLKLRKRLFIRRERYYILKVTYKLNNTYITFIDNFGHTLFVYSAGRFFASQGGDSAPERKGFGIPKSEKPKRHKKIVKDDQQENKNSKNKLRIKKRRKAKNALKQILQVFIKKLIDLKIFNIKILEIKKNSRKSILIILRSLYKYGIRVEQCVSYSARPHNNASGIKFKKMPRK